MHDNTPEVTELVRMLRRLRAAAGNPTLAAISRRTSVSVATLSRLFAGSTLPSRQAVVALAKALTTDGNELNAVNDLYLRALMERDRARPRHPRLTAASATGKDPELQQFQDNLQALVRSSGLSVRQLAARTGIARSTISDALHHTRLPRPDTVAAIAEACGDAPDSWKRAVTELARAHEQAAKTAREESSPSPSDTLIEAAVTRSPAEIAALAANLKDNGQSAVAARLVETAVKERTVEDVAALAVALLNPTPDRDGEGESLAEVPPQKQEPTSWWRRRLGQTD